MFEKIAPADIAKLDTAGSILQSSERDLASQDQADEVFRRQPGAKARQDAIEGAKRLARADLAGGSDGFHRGFQDMRAWGAALEPSGYAVVL